MCCIATDHFHGAKNGKRFGRKLDIVVISVEVNN
jgi:hypothetical protein